MEAYELMKYLKQTQEYIEYSFYKNSAEIMESIIKYGIDKVLNISSFVEHKKGIFECSSTWKIDANTSFNKNITINISGEMIYITEVLNDSDTPSTATTTSENKDNIKSTLSSPSPDIDIQKEYGEILDLLRSKPLSSTEKSILTKVVAAFFR